MTGCGCGACIGVADISYPGAGVPIPLCVAGIKSLYLASLCGDDGGGGLGTTPPVAKYPDLGGWYWPIGGGDWAADVAAATASLII